MQIIKKTNTEILELKNSTNEIQNAIESINCIMEQGKKEKLWVRRQELWYYPVRGEKRQEKRSEDSLHDLWVTTKRNNLQITKVPEGEEGGAENIFKYMITENFLTLGRDLYILVYQAHRSPTWKDCPPDA